MEMAENYNEDIIVEKEEVIVEKELENREIWRKKSEKKVHNMKSYFENSIEVNNHIKLNVDEQQDDINI